jgi:hypothetical protein
MSTAVLRGREHPMEGDLAAVAEDAAAVALSRGGAPKRYPHADPNEDVVAFVRGEAGVLLCVADGHGGCEAAEAAVERLTERRADWTDRAPFDPEAWPETAARAVFEACSAIHLRAATGGRDTSRTTLSVALVRPADDLLAWASIGDSHVFAVGADGAEDLALYGDTTNAFLGHPAETRDSLDLKLSREVRPLRGLRAVVLASDGLSERGIGVAQPATAVAEAVQRAAKAADGRPDRLALEAARGIVDVALDAQRRQRAGDNVAVAVWMAPAGGNGPRAMDFGGVSP